MQFDYQGFKLRGKAYYDTSEEWYLSPWVGGDCPHNIICSHLAQVRCFIPISHDKGTRNRGIWHNLRQGCRLILFFTFNDRTCYKPWCSSDEWPLCVFPFSSVVFSFSLANRFYTLSFPWPVFNIRRMSCCLTFPFPFVRFTIRIIILPNPRPFFSVCSTSCVFLFPRPFFSSPTRLRFRIQACCWTIIWMNMWRSSNIIWCWKSSRSSFIKIFVWLMSGIGPINQLTLNS